MGQEAEYLVRLSAFQLTDWALERGTGRGISLLKEVKSVLSQRQSR
jgi:hypothetical protein